MPEHRLLCRVLLYLFHWAQQRGSSFDYESLGEIKSKVDWSVVGRAREKELEGSSWQTCDPFPLLLLLLLPSQPLSVFVLRLLFNTHTSFFIFLYQFFLLYHPCFTSLLISPLFFILSPLYVCVCVWHKSVCLLLLIGPVLTCSTNRGDFLFSFLLAVSSKQGQPWHIYIQCAESGGFAVCVWAVLGSAGDTQAAWFACSIHSVCSLPSHVGFCWQSCNRPQGIQRNKRAFHEQKHGLRRSPLCNIFAAVMWKEAII